MCYFFNLMSHVTVTMKIGSPNLFFTVICFLKLDRYWLFKRNEWNIYNCYFLQRFFVHGDCFMYMSTFSTFSLSNSLFTLVFSIPLLFIISLSPCCIHYIFLVIPSFILLSMYLSLVHSISLIIPLFWSYSFYISLCTHSLALFLLFILSLSHSVQYM